MRRLATTILTAATITLPTANAWAAGTAAKTVVVRKFTGTAAQADRWGYAQVTITVRKTTTRVKGKRKVTRRIVGLTATYPDHARRSVFINEQAIPILRSEALQAQSANIQLVSGASDTSYAFQQSLQSAILKAHEGMTAAVVPGVRRVEHIMGMPIVVDVRDEEAHGEAIEPVFEWLRTVDNRFSTFKEESEVSRIDRGELPVAAAHPDVRRVLARCEELRARTGGYFDMRSGGALDPSGLVKGWSVDRAASILEGAGLQNFAVNAGGDIRLRGHPAPDCPWRIGIQHPFEPDRLAAVVEGTHLAVATSGAYARGDHVLDPHTGRPPRGVLSVTVTGPDLATADAYATAAFAMGVGGPAWTARLHGYEAMTILENEQVLTTAGFPDA